MGVNLTQISLEALVDQGFGVFIDRFNFLLSFERGHRLRALVVQASFSISLKQELHLGRSGQVLRSIRDIGLKAVLWCFLSLTMVGRNVRITLRRGLTFLSLLQLGLATFILLHNEVLVLNILVLDDRSQSLQSLLLVVDLVLKPLFLSASWLVVVGLDIDHHLHLLVLLLSLLLGLSCFFELFTLLEVLLLSLDNGRHW